MLKRGKKSNNIRNYQEAEDYEYVMGSSLDDYGYTKRIRGKDLFQRNGKWFEIHGH